MDPLLENLDEMNQDEVKVSESGFLDFEDDYGNPDDFSENGFINLTSSTTELPLKPRSRDLLGLSKRDIQGLGYSLCLALTLLILVIVVTNFVLLKFYKNRAARAEKDLETRKKNDLEKMDIETAEF